MNPDCPFCTNIASRVILENENAFLVYDKYPVNDGHILVISKNHAASLFELDMDQQISMWKLVNRAKEIIEHRNKPNGYNVGINIGEAAGQTIFHCHIHIIPRYEGDTDSPKGGVRKVVDGLGDY